jgi:putative transposase
MPSRLHRYQQSHDLHFITFSCYGRQPKLGLPSARMVFERAVEQTRRRYGPWVLGYVVMPEHVHLLLSEPQDRSLATALQALKQSVSRTLSLRGREPFGQPRYYDFNVWTAKKQTEKLKYLHRNPVTRGLVARPEDWPWSSYRHYASGAEGVVEIDRGGRRAVARGKGSRDPAKAELERGTPCRPDSETWDAQSRNRVTRRIVLSIGLFGSRTTPIFAHAASLNSQTSMSRSLGDRLRQFFFRSTKCGGT